MMIHIVLHHSHTMPVIIQSGNSTKLVKHIACFHHVQFPLLYPRSHMQATGLHEPVDGSGSVDGSRLRSSQLLCHGTALTTRLLLLLYTAFADTVFV